MAERRSVDRRATPREIDALWTLWRGTKGLKLEVLAELLGVDVSTLSRKLRRSPDVAALRVSEAQTLREAVQRFRQHGDVARV